MGIRKRVLTFIILTAIILLTFNALISRSVPSNISALEQSVVILFTAVNLGFGFTIANEKSFEDYPSKKLVWNTYVLIITFTVMGPVTLMLYGVEIASFLTASLVLVGNILAMWYILFIRGQGEERVETGIHLSGEGLASFLSATSLNAAEEIVLRDKKLASINLTPLSSFTGLKVLDLSRNRLSEIDLSPLSFCTGLEKLTLWNNRLEALDLSPLSSCLHLRELNLMDNRLTHLDLEPLRNCKEFEYLELVGNKITAVDLEPLSACRKFNALNLDGELDELDLTPISSCSLLKILTISSRSLKELDLTPLENCSELDFVMIDCPELTKLDITPLFKCSKLITFQADVIELVAEEPVNNHEWPKGLVKFRKKVQFY